MFWTPEDLNNGLCTVAEVGTQRPEAEVVPPPLPSAEGAPALPLRDRLRNDALAAYSELGGVEYLKKNPELLDKILAKSIVPESVATTNVFQFPEMPWLTSRRLAYKETVLIPDDIWTVESRALAKPFPASRDDPLPE